MAVREAKVPMVMHSLLVVGAQHPSDSAIDMHEKSTAKKRTPKKTAPGVIMPVAHQSRARSTLSMVVGLTSAMASSPAVMLMPGGGAAASAW